MKKLIVLDKDPIHNFLVSLIYNRVDPELEIIFSRDSKDLLNYREEEPSILCVSSDFQITDKNVFENIKSFMDSSDVLGAVLCLDIEPEAYQLWRESGFTFFTPKPFTKNTAIKLMNVFNRSMAGVS